MTVPLVHLPLVQGRTVRRYMQRGEQDVLLALVNHIAPKIMVEVGVNVGITAKAVLSEVTTIERYIGIDVEPGYTFEIPAQQIERPVFPGLLVKSHPRFELVLRGNDLPTEADFVFIDGDHGQRAVREDSIWATQVVRHGGMIVWHDYQNPTVEVTGVLDALLAEGRALRHVAGTWLVFERR